MFWITHYHTTDHKITSQEAEYKVENIHQLRVIILTNLTIIFKKCKLFFQFSTLPWPTTQSPQSSTTQASTVGVKVCVHLFYHFIIL